MTGFNPIHDKLDAICKRLGGDKDAFKKDKAKRLEEEKYRVRYDRNGHRIARPGDDEYDEDDEVFDQPRRRKTESSGRSRFSASGSESTLIPDMSDYGASSRSYIQESGSRRSRGSMSGSIASIPTSHSSHYNATLPSQRSFVSSSMRSGADYVGSSLSGYRGSYVSDRQEMAPPRSRPDIDHSFSRMSLSSKYNSGTSVTPSRFSHSGLGGTSRASLSAGSHHAGGRLGSQSSYMDLRESFRARDQDQDYSNSSQHDGSSYGTPESMFPQSRMGSAFGSQSTLGSQGLGSQGLGSQSSQMSSYVDPRQAFRNQQQVQSPYSVSSDYASSLGGPRIVPLGFAGQEQHLIQRASGRQPNGKQGEDSRSSRLNNRSQNYYSARPDHLATNQNPNNCGFPVSLSRTHQQDRFDHYDEDAEPADDEASTVYHSAREDFGPNPQFGPRSNVSQQQPGLGTSSMRQSASSRSRPLTELANSSFVKGKYAASTIVPSDSVSQVRRADWEDDDTTSTRRFPARMVPTTHPLTKTGMGAGATSIASEYHRGLGDMTRTYVEGMGSSLADTTVKTNHGNEHLAKGNKSQRNRQIGNMNRTHLEGMEEKSDEETDDGKKKKRWYRRF